MTWPEAKGHNQEMERIDSVNPARIAWCCQDREIAPEMLAQETGIALKTIRRVFAGEPALTFNQLTNIAEFFGRGVLFFLEDGPVDIDKVYTPQFRTLANQKPELSHKVKMLIERAEHQREAYLSMREDLDDPHPSFIPPKLPSHDLPAAARIVREWLDLGQQRTFDEYRAAVEAKGVLVFRTNGYAGRWQITKQMPILGFSLYDPACPLIVVKKQAHEPRQTFTLIHELGHLLLHRTSWIDEESDLYAQRGGERAANAFAGLVLLPNAMLSTIRDDERPTDPGHYRDWVEPLTKRLGVSTELVLRRLLDTGRLGSQQYQAYRDHATTLALVGAESKGTRQYRYREPKYLFGDRFVRTVLDALSSRHITLPKASRYLDGLKLKDIRQLDDHCAGL